MPRTDDRHLVEWTELVGAELPDEVRTPEEERD